MNQDPSRLHVVSVEDPGWGPSGAMGGPKVGARSVTDGMERKPANRLGLETVVVEFLLSRTWC
jgi:hypothetical protein